MKKLFLLLALFGVFAVGCEKLFQNDQKPVEKPAENKMFFTDAENNYIFGVEGGEVLVIVATNLDYTIVIPDEAQEWLSVVDTRAEEHIDKCSFIVAYNDSVEERLVTVEFIDTDGKVLQTITFVQNGHPKVFDTDSEGNYRVAVNGGEVKVAVTTNLEYSVVIPNEAQSWLSVADTRVEVREETLTFIVAENETFEERSANVELVDNKGKVLQTISFIQDSQLKVFNSNSNENYMVDAIGDEIKVVVTTNIDYNVNVPKVAQEWLSVVVTRALVHEETLTFIIAKNETFEERSASVELVNGEGEVLQTIAFVQIGQTKVFESDGMDSYTVNATGGEVSVAVTTNLDYSVVIPEDAQVWLSVADTRAVVREETLTFIVAENKVYDRRFVSVELVDSNGDVLRTIQFIQLAAVQPDFTCPANEIWYTNGSITEPTTPYRATAFGASILSNTYLEDREHWVIKFDGEVTSIGDYAFSLCNSLTSVTIPDSVTTIGWGAFRGCSCLTSITVGYGVIKIGDYAFNDCSGLTDVIISDSVITIGEGAFYGCRSLTSVVIPDSVTAIGWGAFRGCSSLTSVSIGNSVATIKDYAFYDCSSLTNVCISDLFAWCNIVFSDYYSNPLYYGVNLYLNNTLVTELVVPSDITEIKSYAFYGSGNLTSIVIPDNVTTIGNSAFEYCSSLTNLTIGNSVTTIGDAAFRDCSNLTSVTIPDCVTTIGGAAFRYCRSLTSVHCKATTPPAGGSDMFSSNASCRKIYVPMESVEAYKSASDWSGYADAIEGYNF